ncbi:MAG TPA: DUF971 domain-containing protein [Candidatus Dormibacteraeota bacterium]|nr:DUF971 domain-containing protein [Candidatus Dormibacteraeota bacterium]
MTEPFSADPATEGTTPRRFAYDEQSRALLVDWMDGTGQAISFGRLRRACPCALCSGELGRPGRFQIDPELHLGEDELADIQLVGNYGLKATWADGHDTGIYRFELLRSLGAAELPG